MSLGLRERRLGNEWELLQELAKANASVLEISDRSEADGDLFRIVLHETCGIVERDVQKILARSHAAEIRFPRFFPSVPIEARLVVPVFHPNIDPQSGFVCLWARFSAGDSVVHAVWQLQQVIAWKQFNLEASHIVQLRAVDWYKNPARESDLPLAFTPLVVPESTRTLPAFIPDFCSRSRRRLFL